MNLKLSTHSHPWDLRPREAVALQRQLSGKVIRTAEIALKDVATVAGVDTHYRRSLATAAVFTLSFPDLVILEYASAVRQVNFPYIPGLLSFREGPVVLDALGNLKTVPDLLIFDGQGIAHPRGFGIASHIGLLLDHPTIGCAKTRLVGQHQEPASEKGSYRYLIDRGETIGAVVRTRSHVKPVYVSIGHRMNLLGSIQVILQCCSRFRLPEPIRRADQLARELTSTNKLDL